MFRREGKDEGREGTGGMPSMSSSVVGDCKPLDMDRLEGRAGRGMARLGRERWRPIDFVGEANGSSMLVRLDC